MEENMKHKDVGTMKRGRTGDLRIVRISLMLVAGDVTWNSGRVLAYDVTRDHIEIYDPTAAGVCYQLKPGRPPLPVLLPGDMLMYKGCTELDNPPTWASWEICP